MTCIPAWAFERNVARCRVILSLITAASIGAYLILVAVPVPEGIERHLMLAVYLAVIGCVAGYFGEQHLNCEAAVRRIEAAKERTQIARELHDGCVQTLAAINLRLGCVRQLLSQGDCDEASAELAELQARVAGEYDAVRAYVRSLAGIEATRPGADGVGDTEFRVSADFGGSALVVEEVLQLVREGIANVRRHAHARRARVDVHADGARVHIDIGDDGVGFGRETPPWSMASRVNEHGGQMQLVRDREPGAHLAIVLPQRCG